MPLARCPKCGRTFPNTLRECPGCGYSPFRRPQPPQQGGAAPQGTPPQGAAQGVPPQGTPPQGAPRPPHPPIPPHGGAHDPDLFETVEAEETESPLRRFLLPGLLVLALVLALIAAWLFFSHRKAPEPEPEPETAQQTPALCADGAHEWKEATCLEPKTCAICGKTEGEPLGHDFVNNVCTRCGMYDRMFVFSELSSRRSGGKVIFSGVVRNYAALPVKELHAKLDLYDEDRQLVTTAWTYLFEDDPLDAYESGQWRFAFDDSGFAWKYWSVSIMGYTFS